MDCNSVDDIVIFGSGIAGTTLSLLLANKGLKNINVYEKRSRDAEKESWNRGRSINMSLSFRGIKTLERAGILTEILQIAIPMRGRMIHGIDGVTQYHPYSPDPSKYLLSISRDALNEKLRKKAEEKPDQITFHYNQQVKDIMVRRSQFTIKDTKTNADRTLNAATMIACDGAYSAVRQAMQKLDRQDFSQSYLEHGYKELKIPAGPNNTFLMEPNCLHIWPRGNYMMIALPNLDGSFTCTLFFPFEGSSESFDKLDTPERISQFFSKTFPDAFRLMPNLLDEFDLNPNCSLLTVKTFPWVIDGKAALVGDAAHSIVPFYGQGMNAALEDVLELYNCIEEQMNHTSQILTSEALNHAFCKYQNKRKKNTDAIADMAVENFKEMRDSVINLSYLFKRRVEHLLETRFPGRFTSRYDLISFSHVPYSEAQRVGRMNEKVLDVLIKDVNYDITKIDLKHADLLIKLMLDK